MSLLKKITKNLFYKYYQIKPYTQPEEDKLSYACDGRIVRSLADSKKIFCGTYILNGIKR